MRAILLVNLGTPQAATKAAVRRYLVEFLTDPRVIDLPWLQRQLIVRGMIIPKRLKKVTESYQAIWEEGGSPLKVHSRAAAIALQDRLGNGYLVRLAMRYAGSTASPTAGASQCSSIADAIREICQHPAVEELIVIPLFPQYASGTTGSILEQIYSALSKEIVQPALHVVHQFALFPPLINAFEAQIRKFDIEEYDKVLFSFHGLPVRHVKAADRSGCCFTAGCCRTLSKQNSSCYSAQCYATAAAIAARLSLPPGKVEISFQSRLGKDPWLAPSTEEVATRLAKEGAKRLLVVSPSFVADCLETLHELGVELRDQFIAHGGQQLDLVPGLNSSEEWIETLVRLATHDLFRADVSEENAFTLFEGATCDSSFNGSELARRSTSRPVAWTE